MARLWPKDRVGPKILARKRLVRPDSIKLGPKVTRKARLDKNKAEKMSRPSARLENGKTAKTAIILILNKEVAISGLFNSVVHLSFQKIIF